MSNNIRRLVLGMTAAMALSLPAAAVSVTPCNNEDFIARADNIAEPWEKNIRSLSNGNVRVALLDTGGEPACCSWHLLILSPSAGDEGEYRACHVVSDKPHSGFVRIDFAKLVTSYDPKKGLLLVFPYRLYDYENSNGSGKSGVAKVRINQATGGVSVEK